MINEKAAALCRMDRPAEAIPLFDLLTKSQIDEIYVVWANRGQALAELERWDEALASFDRAIEINPDYLPASKMRAWLLEFPLKDRGLATS
jgi:tetratricopeptide (TPR) repeat protein